MQLYIQDIAVFYRVSLPREKVKLIELCKKYNLEIDHPHRRPPFIISLKYDLVTDTSGEKIKKPFIFSEKTIKPHRHSNLFMPLEDLEDNLIVEFFPDLAFNAVTLTKSFYSAITKDKRKICAFCARNGRIFEVQAYGAYMSTVLRDSSYFSWVQKLDKITPKIPIEYIDFN